MAKHEWDLVIKPQSRWFDFQFREVWAYRDLVMLFVRRDFVAQVKQTILGPFWHIIRPLFTTFLFIIIFGKIAQLSTDGSPRALFYLSGLVVWNYFSGAMASTSNTFVANANIFGKVYFPRLVIPVATVISSSIRFGIQFLLFAAILLFYVFVKNAPVNITPHIVFLPLIALIMALFGLGCGIIVSSLTTKYRDLSLFLTFGLQLLMYLTPVVYPAVIWNEYQWIMDVNPITPLIECFRYAMMGTGSFDYTGLAYAGGFSVMLFLAGAMLFNRIEKTFMDTV